MTYDLEESFLTHLQVALLSILFIMEKCELAVPCGLGTGSPGESPGWAGSPVPPPEPEGQ